MAEVLVVLSSLYEPNAESKITNPVTLDRVLAASLLTYQQHDLRIPFETVIFSGGFLNAGHPSVAAAMKDFF